MLADTPHNHCQNEISRRRFSRLREISLPNCRPNHACRLSAFLEYVLCGELEEARVGRVVLERLRVSDLTRGRIEILVAGLAQ